MPAAMADAPNRMKLPRIILIPCRRSIRPLSIMKPIEAIDQLHLLLGRSAHQAAVLELGGGKRSHQSGFAAGQAAEPALDGQRTDQRALSAVVGQR